MTSVSRPPPRLVAVGKGSPPRRPEIVETILAPAATPPCSRARMGWQRHVIFSFGQGVVRAGAGADYRVVDRYGGLRHVFIIICV